jgi:uncharacterized protein involved in response to NO
MNFTQFSDDKDTNYFLSQPHQPFFILAFVNAISIMIIFMLSYKGIINLSISTVNFHSYGFIYLLFTPAFLAFLFTTFPRFSSTPAIEKNTYMQVFNLYYMGSILFILGSIVSPILSIIGMILVFAGHIRGMLILKNIYTLTTMEDKHDIHWILYAMQFGVIAHFLFLIGELFYAPFVGLSMEIATYLYLFLLTFTVSQRMVPFFSHCMIDKNVKLLKQIFLLLILHIILEGIMTNSAFIVDMALAYLIGKELLGWKLPFPNPNPLLWILHISLFWVPVAFALTALTNFITLVSGISFLALDMHILTLGFVFSMLIGFGTRVTLGHSGNIMQADLWVKGLFIWTQVVVSVRILVSIISSFGWDFMLMFDISAIVWLLMFIAWGLKFFAVLILGKKLS